MSKSFYTVNAAKCSECGEVFETHSPDDVCDHECRVDLRKFWSACYSKMKLKADEDNRSMEPWNVYDIDYLYFRLGGELSELEKVAGTPEAPEELVDVANMCAFIWLKIKIDGGE